MMSRLFSPDEAGLIRRVRDHLNRSEFEAALSLVDGRLGEPFAGTAAKNAVLRMALGALLIDIGAEAGIEDAVRRGLSILELEQSHVDERLDRAQFEYNVGNAKKSLFDIAKAKPDFAFKPDSIAVLTEAKNHYWRALKVFEKTGRHLPPTLLVNLGNVLDNCGRVPEALIWYNRALTLHPDFSMAHLNRAISLLWLERLTGVVSVTQLKQVAEGFEIGQRDEGLPAHVRSYCVDQRAQVEQRLASFGYTRETAGTDHANTREEADSHSPFRRFCIENHLCLSEHALYCGCVGARRDDLTIPKRTSSIGGAFVGRMEMLLNRLKSEFSLARALYYQAAEDGCSWETEEFESTYTELAEGEVIGMRPEMIRTSFRICFGVLDKIAHGICDLFALAGPQEHVYFHSFWKKQQPRDHKQKERWDIVNALKNPALIALYSLATDLDACQGEWNDFKAWRNALEHELLVLSSDSSDSLGPLVGENGFDGRVVVEHDTFRDHTLRLLQFTASAIFSFIFCVRYEGTKASRINDAAGISVTLEQKPIGPD